MMTASRERPTSDGEAPESMRPPLRNYARANYSSCAGVAELPLSPPCNRRHLYAVEGASQLVRPNSLDLGWIDQRFPRSGPGCVCRARWLNVARAQDMKHRLASGDQVVGNDAPVASPPYGFRAHDSATSRMPQVPQLGKTGAEGVCHGVVGIVVKALVLPEGVYRTCDVERATSQPS